MTQRFNDGIIDLSAFRAKKEEEAMVPFFKDSTLITLGNEDESQVAKYILLVNIVANGKQIIAIESASSDDIGEVAIVEAIIEDGNFTGVEAIASEEEYTSYVKAFTDIMQQKQASENGEEIQFTYEGDDSNDDSPTT